MEYIGRYPRSVEGSEVSVRVAETYVGGWDGGNRGGILVVLMVE